MAGMAAAQADLMSHHHRLCMTENFNIWKSQEAALRLAQLWSRLYMGASSNFAKVSSSEDEAGYNQQPEPAQPPAAPAACISEHQLANLAKIYH